MTLSTTGIRISYAGNASATAFPFPYKFDANGDLVVILRDALAVETTQLQGTNYTATGAGLDAGGTVTMIVAPPTGTTLVIIRQPPITQLTSYNDNDPFPAKSHEAALDKRTEVEQWLADQLGRTLRLKATDALGFGSYQALGQRISGVADASASNDAVTLEQLLAVQSLIGIGTGTQVTSYATRLAASLATIAGTVTYLATSGYATVGDQGNAVYKRDTVLTSGGFQSVDGAFWSLVTRPVRPQHFGAKGDGVTDDTIALQAALTYVGAAGGGLKLYMPAATYIISMVANAGGVYALQSSVAGVSVVGDGPGATIIKNKASSAVVSAFQMTGNSQSIRSLTLDGNRLNGGNVNVSPNLINVAGVSAYGTNFVLDSCECMNIGFQGIIFGSAAHQMVVSNNSFHDIGAVLDTNGAGVKMVGVPGPVGGVVKNNSFSSIYGLTVPGPAGGPNYGGGAIALGGTQMVVDGNYIINCYNAGGVIAEQNSPGVQGITRDWILTNNILIISSEPSNASTYFFELSGQNYVISGNIMEGGKGGLVAFETAPTFFSGNASVASNVCVNTRWGVQTLESGGGVPRFITIVGNKFKGQSTAAVEISVHASQIVIVGNEMSEVTTPLSNAAAAGEVICEGNTPTSVGSPRVLLNLPAPVATSGTITTAGAVLKYHRRGKEIDIHVEVVITTNGTGAGAIQVTGFPFTFANAHTLMGKSLTSGKGIQLALTNGGTSGLITDVTGAYAGANATTLEFDGTVEVA